jgi:hypothetical protein
VSPTSRPVLATLLIAALPSVALAQEGEDDWLSALEDDVEEEQAEERAGGGGDGTATEDGPLVLPLMGETTFSLTDTTILEYRRNPAQLEGVHALVLTEKLDLAAQGEGVRIGVRLDAFAPFRDAQCERDTHSLCLLEYDFRVPERATLLWEPGDFTLELGDSYAVFGRGLALSFRKVDLLGIDTALRGGHVQHDGDHFTFELLGGLANPQNLDPITLEVFDDPTDVVVGGAVGTRLGEGGVLELGTHVVRIWFEENETSGVDVSATVFGWRAGAPSLLDGHLALYGEANAMVREGLARCGEEERCWGRAVYGSAQVTAGQVSVLVEWKDYRDYLLAPSNSTAAQPWRVYSDAPSLDRDTERFRGIHNSRGGALQIDYAIPESVWSVAVNGVVYGHEDENVTVDPWDGVLVTHGWASLRRQNEDVTGDELAWSLELAGGRRRETHLRTEEALWEQGDLDWEVLHGEIDATVGQGDHAFELVVEHRAERRLFLEYVDYVRGGATLTWSYAGVLSLSAILRWTDEKKDLQTLWPGGEARWDFTEGSHIRVFGGLTPGGRICSGGVCRDVPPFEGALAELVLRL